MNAASLQLLWLMYISLWGYILGGVLILLTNLVTYNYSLNLAVRASNYPPWYACVLSAYLLYYIVYILTRHELIPGEVGYWRPPLVSPSWLLIFYKQRLKLWLRLIFHALPFSFICSYYLGYCFNSVHHGCLINSRFNSPRTLVAKRNWMDIRLTACMRIISLGMLLSRPTSFTPNSFKTYVTQNSRIHPCPGYYPRVSALSVAMNFRSVQT
jgi:hypothetical protein